MKLRTRDILLLVVAWVFVAVALVAAVLVLRSGAPGPAVGAAPAPTHTVVYTQVTARSLYPRAEEAARAWQADAQPVSLTATWRETALDLVGQPGEWVFRFYSPALGRYYFVVVKPDGAVQGIEHARPVDLPPPVIPPESWQVDSVQALAAWLDRGGGDMLRAKPGVEVSAQLNVASQAGEPAWTVVGYDTQDNDYLTVIVDAASGKVLHTVRP